MPKINIYLSDELAEAVKDAGLPVSAICQRALEQAVARVTAIRETVMSDGTSLRTILDAGALNAFTQRAHNVIALAIDDATTDRAPIGTEHLLAALLAEDGNLALSILRSMEIEPQDVARTLAARRAMTLAANDIVDRATGADRVRTDTGGDPAFDAAAQEALRLTVTEATSLGHNYIGCEHLLLGLVGEPNGMAGQLLRTMGADPRLTRQAVAAALVGYAHLRANSAAKAAAGAGGNVAAMLTSAVKEQLAPIVTRLERLENRLPDPPE